MSFRSSATRSHRNRVTLWSSSDTSTDAGISLSGAQLLAVVDIARCSPGTAQLRSTVLL